MSETLAPGSENALKLEHTTDLVMFFIKRAVTDPSFKGYERCARSLALALNRLSGEDRADLTAAKVDSFAITLRPSGHNPSNEELAQMDPDQYLAAIREARNYEIFDWEEPAATSALMLLGYRLTEAEQIRDERTENNPWGRVLMRGHYKGQQIYFVETYGRGDFGNFMSWTVTATAPEELLFPPVPEPAQAKYSKKTEKAIKRARRLQRRAAKSDGEGHDHQLSWYLFVGGLPVAEYTRDMPESEFNVDLDQQAA